MYASALSRWLNGAAQRDGHGAPVEEGLAKDHLLRKAPRDRLSCHARRPRELAQFVLLAERRRRGTPRALASIWCGRPANSARLRAPLARSASIWKRSAMA